MKPLSLNNPAKLVVAAFVGLFLLTLASSPVVQADDPPDTPPKRTIYVRLDPVFNPQRIPPPPPRDPNVIGAQAISFNVTFDDGGGCGTGNFSAWPQAAKDAFNYAANQWSALVNGTVPIEIHACWQSDLPQGVLGGASHEWRHATQFIGEPIANSWYPTALADQLQGSNTNPGTYDIFATFASGYNWYLGTDGNPASTEMDFVTVVMHEIGHGLGFDGLMNYGTNCGGATSGCWGYGSDYPGVFDRFVETGSGQKLLDTAVFPNPSVALGNELIGNNLYFNGPNANAAWNSSRPQIYAPDKWSSGSSYVHLDFNTFNPTDHALMVYALSKGAARHHPGAVTLGIFKDMGWSLAIPNAPSNLNASAASASQIDLSWTDNSDDETGFKIERSLTGSSGWVQITTVGANITTFSDTSLPASTTHYYRVRAYTAGNSDYSNTANATTPNPPAGAPNPPTNLSLNQVSAGQIDLSWTDNSDDETGFKIERSLTGVSGWSQLSTVGADVTSYSDTSVSSGTIYYYQVRAYNGEGNSTYSGVASSAKKVYLPLVIK